MRNAADLPRHALSLGRVDALDVFRGLSVALMLLVNNPGDWKNVHPQLRHATWDGWTPTDLIFPAFLCIAGTALAISVRKRQDAVGSSRLHAKLAWRCCLLIVVGLGLSMFGPLLKGFPDGFWETVRFPGVLQRIGLCLWIVGSLALCLSPLLLFIAMLALTGAYLYMMQVWHVPGFGVGMSTPAGTASAYIDRWIFGASHLWKGGPYDPEGLITSLSACLNVYIGYLMGQVLLRCNTDAGRIARWFLLGAVCTASGFYLDRIHPINKPIWSVSFSLLTSGIAALAFTLMYFVTEILHVKSLLHPLRAFGMNALLLYVLAALAARAIDHYKIGKASLKQWGYESLISSWISKPTLASAVFGIAFVLVFFLLAHWLYRRRIFVRL